MQAPTAVSVQPRDSFTTDPFFLAARQTLERCLVELTEKHRELRDGSWPSSGWPAHCCCCCGSCGPQAVSRLGHWPPAAFIPCLLCCPSANAQIPAAPVQLPYTEPQAETMHNSPACLLPGQLSFTTNNFEMLLNVQGFQPHEIKVCVKDDCIEVSAEQQPLFQQQMSQSTLKRYRLPCPVNTDLMQCSLSKDGILFLTAPWK